MSTQKDKLKEFRSVCQATEKVAKSYLKHVDWNLELAMNNYFQDNSLREPQKLSKEDEKVLSRMFDKYEDPDDKNVSVSPYLEEFLRDISCDPEGRNALGLMWILGAQRMGMLTRQEFIQGFSALNCTNINAMKYEAGPSLTAKFLQENHFRTFYKWLFDYLKEDDKKRTISVDIALAVWNIIFKGKDLALLEPLTNFVSESDSIVFNKDLWIQSYDFLRETAADFSNYDETGAWPSAIDEFVDSMKKNRKRLIQQKHVLQ